MAHHNQRNTRVEAHRQMPDTMTSITTQYFKNIQKLQTYIRNLETTQENLETYGRRLQEREIPGSLLNLTQASSTQISDAITVSHCLLSMFNQLYTELLHSLNMQNEALREKNEELQTLQVERQAVAQRLQQKEEAFEQMSIRNEHLNDELVNLQEYKEDTSTKLMLLTQEFTKVEESINKYKSEHVAMQTKFEEQKEEMKRINLTNQQLSITLADNAVLIQKMMDEAQAQALYIKELHSMHVIKESINEQLQRELERSLNKAEQLEKDNWVLVNSLTETTRQYQKTMDQAKDIKNNNGLLKSRISFLENCKEKLESDLWKSNRMLDKTERKLQGRREHSF